MPEIYALDLDEDLLSHLAVSESIDFFRAEHLDPVLIEDEGIREIYEWQIDHVRRHGKPATATVLCDEFDLDVSEPETAVGDLMDRLRERYMKNQAKSRLERVVKEYHDGDKMNVPHVMIKEGREMLGLVAARGEAFGPDDIERARTLYNRQVLTGRGPSLGFEEITDWNYGQKGLTVLAATPKTGKSWVGIKAAYEEILAGGHPWIYALEMPAVDMQMRLACMASNVPFWKYIRNALTQEDWGLIDDAIADLKEAGNFNIIKPPRDKGERTIERMHEAAHDAGATTVIIDQAQHVEFGTPHGFRTLGTADTREWWGPIELAKDLSEEVPVFLIHQFNRTAGENKDTPPIMQQVKASASIEETATLVLGLWANRDMRKSRMVRYYTLAARNAEWGNWNIEFNLARNCKLEYLGEAEEEDESD